jgi:hypothetical protein
MEKAHLPVVGRLMCLDSERLGPADVAARVVQTLTAMREETSPWI